MAMMMLDSATKEKSAKQKEKLISMSQVCRFHVMNPSRLT